MASKQVVDRQRSADSVIAIGAAQADSIGSTLDALAKPHVKKGEAPHFGVTVRALVAALDGAKTAMITADEAHQAELDDDPQAREARDAAGAALYDKVVDMRQMITGAFGTAAHNKLFTGATPEDPVVVARFAGELANKLDKTKFPASRIEGAKLDPKKLAAELREMRAAVENALSSVQREVREGQVTLQAKSDAINAYDKTFSGVATALSGFLKLAGKPDLAAKVRPSASRPGVVDDAETVPEATPEESGTPPGGQ